jgi:hypothetical protein
MADARSRRAQLLSHPVCGKGQLQVLIADGRAACAQLLTHPGVLWQSKIEVGQADGRLADARLVYLSRARE